MYFHTHGVNIISWSSCCRLIQASLATNLSQKKLLENVWRYKDSKLQSPIRMDFSCVRLRAPVLAFLHTALSPSPSKKVSQAMVTESNVEETWKKCRSFDQRDEKLAKNRKLYPLLSLHKM